MHPEHLQHLIRNAYRTPASIEAEFYGPFVKWGALSARAKMQNALAESLAAAVFLSVFDAQHQPLLEKQKGDLAAFILSPPRGPQDPQTYAWAQTQALLHLATASQAPFAAVQDDPNGQQITAAFLALKTAHQTPPHQPAQVRATLAEAFAGYQPPTPFPAEGENREQSK